MSNNTATPTVAQAYDRIEYRNGDATAVYLLDLNGAYQVLVAEVNREGEIIETEAVGHADDREEARGMAKYWIDNNPNGLGGDGGGLLGGGGILGGD